ncbi:MAG TPA: TIM-barrel domain-containing protein [Phycisphaerales bacterium]|nr:TIM-barrel domain-containing protein [Phycisphaerales bacterium]
MHAGLNAYLTGDGVARFLDERHSMRPLPPFPGWVDQPVRRGPLPLGFPIRVKFTRGRGRARGRTVIELVNAPLAHFYGTGEQAGRLLRNGTRKVLWNRDSYGYSDKTESLYQSHPFVLGLSRGVGGSRRVRAFGIVVESTYRCVIDLRRAGRVRFEVEGPSPAVTVIPRDTPEEVVRVLAELTGKMELPPKWALGYHQCRYTYTPDTRVLEVAGTMRERWIPCDAMWLDIDVMEGYRSFTFDPHTFPNAAAMVRELHEKNFRVVCMVDPGLKVDEGYPLYAAGRDGRHFVTSANGAEYHGKVWPGDCAFPDFTNARTREWFTGLYPHLLNVGVDGVWNDMNEPAVFGVPSKTMPEDNRHDADEDLGGPGPHAKYHNIYGMQMARASLEALRRHAPDTRPFLLTRAGFLGSQRYAATWTGDNVASEAHYRWTVPMALNLGLSGQPFCGPDIGGFVGNTEPGLFARWIGVGALMPFCRGHKDKGTLDHEPWSFGGDVEHACRLALERRYRLMPYLYTVFWQASRTGVPVVRPVFFVDGEDPALRAVDNAFLLGIDVLVCLPGGRAFSPQQHRAFAAWKRLHVTEDHPALPHCYLAPGAVLPVGPVVQHTREPLRELTLFVNLEDGAASGLLYEDDGQTLAYQRGEFRVTRFNAIEADSVWVAEVPEHEGYRPPERSTEVVVL